MKTDMGKIYDIDFKELQRISDQLKEAEEGIMPKLERLVDRARHCFERMKKDGELVPAICSGQDECECDCLPCQLAELMEE